MSADWAALSSLVSCHVVMQAVQKLWPVNFGWLMSRRDEGTVDSFYSTTIMSIESIGTGVISRII